MPAEIIHKHVANMAENAHYAWNKQAYASAIFYGITSRILSAAAIPFQLLMAAPILVFTVREYIEHVKVIRKEWGISSYEMAALAFRVSTLSLKIIFEGLLLSIAALAMSEVVYIAFKVQKYLYGNHVLLEIELDVGVPQHQLLIRQAAYRNVLGLDLDFALFRKEFKAIWKKAAIEKNLRSYLGNPDSVYETREQSIRKAINDQLNLQLQNLDLIDPTQAQAVRLRIQGLQPVVIPVQPVVNHRTPERVTLSKILCSYMKKASKDLVQRNCYTKEDLEDMAGCSYNAVIGLGIFYMLSDAVLTPAKKEITLQAAAMNLVLNSKTNVLDFKNKFLALKEKILELETGMQGPQGDSYKRTLDIVIKHLSGVPSKEDEVREEQQKLQKENEELSKIEKAIFLKIGELIDLANRQLINSHAVSNSQKVNWVEAFTI